MTDTNDANKSKWIKMKIAVLGDPNVGKSHFINSYLESDSCDTPCVTQNYLYKRIEKTIKQNKFLIDIYEFNSTNDKIISYISNSDVVLLVLDLNDRNSFDNLNEYWFHFLKADCCFCNEIIILGNNRNQGSVPLTSNEEVDEMIKISQTQIFVSYIEIGNKTKDQMNELIDELVLHTHCEQLKNNKDDSDKAGSFRVDKCSIY